MNVVKVKGRMTRERPEFEVRQELTEPLKELKELKALEVLEERQVLPELAVCHVQSESLKELQALEVLEERQALPEIAVCQLQVEWSAQFGAQ